MTQANLMTKTMKGQLLTVITDKAETLQSITNASFFNKTPRIVSPMSNYND